MAYELISGPLFANLPTHIIEFATTTLGWVSPSPGKLIIPDSDPDVSVNVDIEDVASGTYRYRLRAQMFEGSTVLSTALSSRPYIARVFQEPVALNLFGGSAPDPWLAAAIEYDGGIFRHFYIGRLSRLGNYGGGEVVSGSTYRVYDYALYRDIHQYLFGGFQNIWGASQSGGVRITHADVGGTIVAPFLAQFGADVNAPLNVNCALGGFRDNINDQQLARAQNTYAGVQVFNPVNLYLTRESSRVSPIGHPPGVRLVSMANLGPGAVVNVGNKTWRCFPQFKKGVTELYFDQGNDNLLDETSYTAGVAYVED